MIPQDNMTEEQINKIIDARVKQEVKKALSEAQNDDLSGFNLVDRYEFQKHLQLLNGRNISVGRSVGTILATEADQKLGLYGTTPVIQGTAISAPSISNVSGTPDDSTINSNFGQNETAINDIRGALSDIGIINT